MVKFALIIKTIKSTKNFWQIAFLKTNPEKRKISFRNGVTMEIDLLAYYKMRDLFCAINSQKFRIRKGKEGFVVSKEQPNFNCLLPTLETLDFFYFLLLLNSENWNINQIGSLMFKADKKASYEISILKDHLFSVESEKISLVSPLESLTAYFLEFEKGVYDSDYNGKVVLDVGGFCGESAVFFASRGAKKVIIYEPVKAHHELIRKNVAVNAIQAELHEEGIGQQNGCLNIKYEATDLGFGLLSKGKEILTIQIKSTQDVISQSKADIAKIDCEGAELSLVDVPQQVLRLIRIYIIETHTKAIQEAVTKKFLSSGFRQTRAPVHLLGEISITYFEKTT